MWLPKDRLCGSSYLKAIPATQPPEKHISDSDKELRARLARTPVWREQDELVRSVPGVGPVMSLTLLASLAELGRLTRKQIAALVGVVPSLFLKWRLLSH